MKFYRATAVLMLATLCVLLLVTTVCAETSKAPNAATRYYVTVRSPQQTEWTDYGLEFIRSALAAKPDFAVVPSYEPVQLTIALLSKYKMQGYLLKVEIAKPVYDTRHTLTVATTLAVYTYPQNGLLSVFPAHLSQPGVTPGNRAMELQLVRSSLEHAVANFTTFVRSRP